MLGLLQIPILLLACLAEGRSIKKRYQPNHGSQPFPSCTTNAECLQLGQPLKRPAHLHLPGRLQTRATNPIDNITFTCGDSLDLPITSDLIGSYTYIVVGASGGAATSNANTGGFGGEARGTLEVTAGYKSLIIRVGCRGFDSPRAGGGGGASGIMFDTVNAGYVFKAVGGGGGGAGYTRPGVNANIASSAGTADSGGRGISGSAGSSNIGTFDSGGGGGGWSNTGGGVRGPKSGSGGQVSV